MVIYESHLSQEQQAWVDEGVWLECSANAQITEVLSVSRKPTGVEDPKLKEYIVSDFLSLKENDETLKGYDAWNELSVDECQRQSCCANIG